jgi:hypothetical protein
MRLRFLVPALVLFAFGIWSTTVVLEHGYFGFIEVAMREPWAMQVLLDLGISCVLLLSFWLVPDARRRGIPVWPYVLATATLGSIGPLAYLVHRELKGEAPASSPAESPVS